MLLITPELLKILSVNRKRLTETFLTVRLLSCVGVFIHVCVCLLYTTSGNNQAEFTAHTFTRFTSLR